MKRYYKDPYGNTASITDYKDGKAKLVVRNICGKISKTGIYDTHRAARGVMGRLSDSWAEGGEISCI